MMDTVVGTVDLIIAALFTVMLALSILSRRRRARDRRMRR